MTRRAAATLVFMLSLPAAALLVAADGADVGTIRLPSDGGEGLAALPTATEAREEETNKGGEEHRFVDQVTAAWEDVVSAVLGDGEEERPWTCCDRTTCTKSSPPTCRCLDEVEECAPACKCCEPFGINPKIKVCNDHYHGDPGPKCSKDDDDVPAGCPSIVVSTKIQLLLVSLILLFV